MAILQVNPTRMELSKLKKRLKTAVKGHKILKDKRDEMARQFMALVRENRRIRQEVEPLIAEAQAGFLLARMLMQEQEIEEAVLFPVTRLKVKAEKKNVMSIDVPKISVEEEKLPNEFLSYGVISSSGELDESIQKMKQVVAHMVRLAEIEHACDMLADEIEKTRRRVNALDCVMIPQLKETIKYIVMRLDENERANISRLMKMKDIIASEANS